MKQILKVGDKVKVVYSSTVKEVEITRIVTRTELAQHFTNVHFKMTDNEYHTDFDSLENFQARMKRAYDGWSEQDIQEVEVNI